MAFSSRLKAPAGLLSWWIGGEDQSHQREQEQRENHWKPLKTCAKTLCKDLVQRLCAKTLCKDVKSEKRLDCARLLISRPGRPSKSQNDCVVRPLHHIQNRHQAECCIGSVSAGKTKRGPWVWWMQVIYLRVHTSVHEFMLFMLYKSKLMQAEGFLWHCLDSFPNPTAEEGTPHFLGIFSHSLGFSPSFSNMIGILL